MGGEGGGLQTRKSGLIVYIRKEANVSSIKVNVWSISSAVSEDIFRELETVILRA